MTITLPLDLIAAFVTEQPWPTVALVFLVGVVLPAIWSRRRFRRRAAMTVIRALLNTCRAVAAVAADVVDSPRQVAPRGGHADRSGLEAD